MFGPTRVITAATALAAGLLAVAAPPAQAAPGDCLEWGFGGPTAINVTGNFVPPDNDGFNLTFVANGKTVNAPATMDSVPIAGSLHGTMKGSINGTGVNLTFTSDQQNPVTIALNGNIGPDGAASGGTSAPYEGGNWKTTSPLNCTKKEEAAPPPEPEKPKNPDVSGEPILGGLVVHIKDNSGTTSNCHYDSEVVDRDFTLNANSTFDLRIVPAVRLFRAWPVTVSCDNGTSTKTTINF